MKSITIHALDDTLASRIQEKAQAEGTSQNKTIKKLLQEALGLQPSSRDHRQDFQGLCGVWSQAEAEAFARSIEDLGSIHPGDWT